MHTRRNVFETETSKPSNQELRIFFIHKMSGRALYKCKNVEFQPAVAIPMTPYIGWWVGERLK